MLLKDAGLLSDVLTLFLRAVFALQRRRARRQDLQGGQVGAVSFIQFLGSALQVTPHFHSLVPNGVFVPRKGGVCFETLPPPTQAEVERLLRGATPGAARLLEKRGALPAQGPEDARQTRQEHSLQQRLRWTEVDAAPARKQPRCAVLEGFSLHANTRPPSVGGRRRMLAYLTAPSGVSAILEHLELSLPRLRGSPAAYVNPALMRLDELARIIHRDRGEGGRLRA